MCSLWAMREFEPLGHGSHHQEQRSPWPELLGDPGVCMGMEQGSRGCWDQRYVPHQNPAVCPASHPHSESGGFAVIFWKALWYQIICVASTGTWKCSYEVHEVREESWCSAPWSLAIHPNSNEQNPGCEIQLHCWMQEASLSTNVLDKGTTANLVSLFTLLLTKCHYLLPNWLGSQIFESCRLYLLAEETEY